MHCRAPGPGSQRASPTAVGRELRRRILVALDLLAWIDSQATNLADVLQEDLDRWLKEETTQRRNRVRYFLAEPHPGST